MVQMHIRQDTGQEYQYYHYVPSIAAAIVFAILFGASTAMHTYQMFKTKTWFLVPFLIGGICKSNSQPQTPRRGRTNH